MLQTDRLLIRPARADDADSLFDVYSDAETMRHWDSLPDTELAMTAKRVTKFMAAPMPQTYLVFEHKGRAIGTGGIHQGAEIGYILNRAYWRQGLMREAMGVMIPWLFETRKLDQLTADVDPRNAGSIRLLESVGFVETGREENTIKVGDEWCDSIYLALARDRWAG